MLQFIFRTTLLVSIAGALLAVEFNSFHKATTVTPVQVTPALRAAADTALELAISKRPARAGGSKTQSL